MMSINRSWVGMALLFLGQGIPLGGYVAEGAKHSRSKSFSRIVNLTSSISVLRSFFVHFAFFFLVHGIAMSD